MGRHAAGWTIRCPEGRTIWLVRFQHDGLPVELSTGERDRGAASRRAAEIYGRVITGQSAPTTSTDLVDAFAAWLADYTMAHTPETAKGAEGYARGLLLFFRGFERLTAAGYAAYMRERIGQVSRETLRKELSALRMFASWLKVERGILLPLVPGLPKHGHPGVRGQRARRQEATILSPAEVAAILAALPLRGERGGAWVRPFVALCWETSLRPYATVARLETPLHYRRGGRTLFISREIDKAKYKRTVPLSAGAREALDLVCPDRGPLFSSVNENAVRYQFEKAARAAGIDRPVSIYDIRHSRISYWVNSGRPLAGAAFLAGHTDISTTAKYVTASPEAASAVLEPAPQRPKKGRLPAVPGGP